MLCESEPYCCRSGPLNLQLSGSGAKKMDRMIRIRTDPVGCQGMVGRKIHISLYPTHWTAVVLVAVVGDYLYPVGCAIPHGNLPPICLVSVRTSSGGGGGGTVNRHQKLMANHISSYRPNIYQGDKERYKLRYFSQINKYIYEYLACRPGGEQLGEI